MHRLAIVIPYYKIDHFTETLRSLKNQSDQDFILYIGNDAGPDDPLPLISQFFEPGRYQYFNYHHNLGAQNIALQWARLLKEVKEEWIQILGDDDFISENLVSEFHKIYHEIPETINLIKVKSVICDESGKVTKELYNRYATGRYNAVEFLLRKLSGRLNSSLSEHIFRRSKYEEVGFADYHLAWHTDDRLILELTDYQTFYFLAEAKVFVRVFAGSTSGSNQNLELKKAATMSFFYDFSDYLKKENISWTLRRDFLKSLRKDRLYIGNDQLAELYYYQGFSGRIYYWSYQLKLKVKRLLPDTFVKHIQSSRRTGQ